MAGSVARLEALAQPLDTHTNYGVKKMSERVPYCPFAAYTEPVDDSFRTSTGAGISGSTRRELPITERRQKPRLFYFESC
jgi:hypothetical protein